MTSSLLVQEQQNYDLNTEFSRINTAPEYLKNLSVMELSICHLAFFSGQVTNPPHHIHTETLLIVL